MDPEEPPKTPIIFTCSGAADTGGLADAASRALSRSGVARMYCLAGVGSRVEEIMADMSKAERLVSVDGCTNDCSRKVLEAAGFQAAIHLRITDLGMPKGQTPYSEAKVRRITDELRRRLLASPEEPGAPEDGEAGV
ncbi:MAG: putative zinc-binding protein [Bryobacteraceae bacterium]|nr:putative zinc-binding protein [Bryobacteraceae bacterium]